MTFSSRMGRGRGEGASPLKVRTGKQREVATGPGLRWGVLVGLAALLLPLGCSPAPPGSESISGLRLVGTPGRQGGQFSRPRAVAATAGGELVVIDRTGRIQVFDLASGEYLRHWWLDEYENGTPTGLSVDPVDDTLWLADTHYHRVLQYDTHGNLVSSFGEEGSGPGQFVFPTDVAPSPDGSVLWVTDYGVRNRVMKFSRSGEFLGEWGERQWENADLDRPQSIVASPDGARLFVIDAGNSRVNVYDHEGNTLFRIGRAGHHPGELKFPLDIALGPDGLLYVMEYENCRVSRFTQDGEFRGVWGEPGTRPGQFFTPWGIALAPTGEMIIADTNNQRLQLLRDPQRHFLMEPRPRVATAGGGP